MPKVSVVVPVYNVEDYLRECMDSLTRQTLQDIEIICVNDGSKDRSPEILREYAGKDSRIILIDQENSGYGKAMNTGMDKATGEYLGIVEPDDYVALTMFEDLYQCAAEQNLDWVKADYCRFTTDQTQETRTFKHIHLSPDHEDYGKVFTPAEKKASFFFVMNTWAGIYRISFLNEYGIRHHETPGASFQDNGFWFQTLLYARRAMILDRPYYRVRRDNPNSSIRNPEKVYAMNREYDYIRGILEKDPAVWQEMKEIYWRQRIRNYGATLDRIADEYRAEYLETISHEMTDGLEKGEYDPEQFPEEDMELAKRLQRKEYTPPPALADEAEMLRNSRSYRIGRAITYLPGKVYRTIRGNPTTGGKR